MIEPTVCSLVVAFVANLSVRVNFGRFFESLQDVLSQTIPRILRQLIKKHTKTAFSA